MAKKHRGKKPLKPLSLHVPDALQGISVAAAVQAADEYKSKHPDHFHGPEYAAQAAVRAIIDPNYVMPPPLQGHALWQANWRSKRDENETEEQRAKRLKKEAERKAELRALRQETETVEQSDSRLAKKRQTEAFSYCARAAAYNATPKQFYFSAGTNGLGGNAKPLDKRKTNSGKVRYRDSHVPHFGINVDRYGQKALRDAYAQFAPKDDQSRTLLAASVKAGIEFAEDKRTILRVKGKKRRLF